MVQCLPGSRSSHLIFRGTDNILPIQKCDTGFLKLTHTPKVLQCFVWQHKYGLLSYIL